MPTFQCKIATGSGEQIRQEMTANTIGEIKDQLRREGKYLVDAHRKTVEGSFFSLKPKARVTSKDFYAFNQEFSVLLKAGIPVVAAFDNILSRKKQKTGFYKILGELRQAVIAGSSVSEGFANYPRLFSPLYIASLRAGESGGDLNGAIARYLNYIRKAEVLKQKVKTASIYPGILLICSLFVVFFLMVFVVPAITGTFVQTGAQVPFMTQLLLSVSGFVSARYISLLIAVSGIFSSGFFLRKWNKGRRFVDRQVVRFPQLGQILVGYAVARFSATLSTLLTNGMPLSRAVPISAGLVNNIYLREAILKAGDDLARGVGFAESLTSAQVLPGMAVSMIAAGEEGGSLARILMDVAEFYDLDVENRLTLLTSSIEPLLMVIMGGVIGFIVIAMYMPIFQMAGTIG